MRIVFSLLALLANVGVSASSGIDTVCDHAELSVDQGDCQALVDFYHSFNVKNIDGENTWGQPIVENWKGVVTSGGRVIAIILDKYEFDGSLKSDVWLVGRFESSFEKLSALRTLDISGAIHEGPLPDFWDAFPNMTFLALSAEESKVVNSFPKSLQKLENISVIKLGNLKIRGRFPDNWEDFKNLEELSLFNNLFYGEVGGSITELRQLSKLSVGGNPYLWGEFPFSILKNEIVPDLILAGSSFWGEIPDYALNAEAPLNDNIFHNLENNHFSNALSEDVSIYSNDHYHIVLMHNQTLVEDQERHSMQISLNHNNKGNAVLAPKIKGRPARIFIVPDEGYKVSSISGCEGTLEKNVFSISGGQDKCEAYVVFSPCEGKSCVVDFGATNSIPNVKVESPFQGKQLSGVVQFRGWFLMPEWHEFFNNAHYYDRGISFSIRVDDRELISVQQLDARGDVSEAMGYKRQEGERFLGWSVPIYTGELENGPHKLKLFNHVGVQLADVDFSIFNPVMDGKVQYINNVERSVVVSDFPIVGHSSEIAFNVAEQSFTVVNQFDSSGESVRSEEKHFRLGDERRNSNFGNFKKSTRYGDDSAAKIENPSENRVLSGVQSMRGWFISDTEDNPDGATDPYAVDFELKDKGIYIDSGSDDNSYYRSLLPMLRLREDVNARYGISGDVGWSFLWYSGRLKNGWHRADLNGHGGPYNETRFIYQEVEFLSFTPVNELGEQIYVHSYNDEVVVEDFPEAGSDVTLRFDPAGQNFVIVDQKIH